MTDAPPPERRKNLTPLQLGRLQRALDSHRRRAEKLGIPAHDIRAADLLAKSKKDAHGRYLCYASGTVLRFDAEAGEPDKATIGHVFPMSAPPENHPGHVLSNLEIESWAHNQEQNNTRDTPEIARGKRFAVRKPEPVAPEAEPPSRKMGKQTWRPPGYVSPLNSQHPRYVKRGFGR